MAKCLVEVAANYRASARIGADRLPWRSRLAVLSADAIYGAIGEEVVKRGADAWNERVRITQRRKLLLFAQAAIRSLPIGAVNVSREGLWTRPRQPVVPTESRN